MKKLFTLFKKTAEDTINTLKKKRAIHWKQRDVEGKTVLVANTDE